MGQQRNKIEKRRRRQDYLERKKVKAKEALAPPTKVKARKAPAKKKTAEAKPAETAGAAAE